MTSRSFAEDLGHLFSHFSTEPYPRPVSFSLHSASRYLLPPILGHYVLALLACLPNTRLIRAAIVVPVVFSACRAAAVLDLAYGFEDERMAYINQGFSLAATTLSMQAISWACSAEPYRRVEAVGLANGNVANGNGASSVSHNKQSHVGVWQKFFDAFHLLCSARGIGWNWSKGLHVPAHTRPTSGRVIFLLYTTTSLIAHLMAMDIIHYYIQTFPQLHLTACPRGATIFAEELPPLQRYALSTYISLLAGPVIYCTVQLGYDLATIIGVGIFQQNPIDWPPMFDHPWKATSLRDFWAKRWHQFFRYIFVTLGSVPFSRILGRVGVPFGAFLISGIVHYFGLWGMSRGTDWRMIGFFLLMAVGIVMEDLWKQSTGRKVRGFYGWLWTTLWVVGWANILVDAWARKGLISSSFYPENYRPAELLFGPLTTTKAEVLC